METPGHAAYSSHGAIAHPKTPRLKLFLTTSLNSIPLRLSTMTNLFNSVGFPIPNGFGDKDVLPNAKRLYSDSLMLVYLRTLNKFG